LFIVFGIFKFKSVIFDYSDSDGTFIDYADINMKLKIINFLAKISPRNCNIYKHWKNTQTR